MQYRRPHVASGLAHAPAASPFRHEEKWPAPGYRVEDFPRTESLIHRLVVIPVGVRHTEGDIDYIAGTIRRIHDELRLA